MAMSNKLYEVEILDKEYSKEAVVDKLRKYKSYNELKDFIRKDIFTISFLKPPFGSLGSEHILKCFEIANYFSSLEFIPDILELRQTFSKLIPNKTFSNKIELFNEEEFYRNRFANIKMTDKELSNIKTKFSLENFCTFDIIAEKTIMLYNSLDGIKTTNSCTGHKYALRFFSVSNLSLQIDKKIVDIKKLKRRFRMVFYNYDKNIFKFSIMGEDRININFFYIPPKNWTEKNKKIPVMKLCEKILNMLISTFNYKPSYDCTNKKFRNSDVQTIEKVRKMLWKFTNILNENLDLSDEDDEKFWEIHRPRCLVFEREYQEYYKSEMSIDIIKKFWKRLEYLGNRLRKNPELFKKF